nr:unnamed protein product [Callosobruchus chinensis]
MHARNFFFSPQGGRPSYIKNQPIRQHLFFRMGVRVQFP